MSKSELCLSDDELIVMSPKRKTKFDIFMRDGNTGYKHDIDERVNQPRKPGNEGNSWNGGKQPKHPDYDAYWLFDKSKYFLTRTCKFKAGSNDIYMTASVKRTRSEYNRSTQQYEDVEKIFNTNVPMFDFKLSTYNDYELNNPDDYEVAEKHYGRYEKNYNPFEYKFKL